MVDKSQGEPGEGVAPGQHWRNNGVLWWDDVGHRPQRVRAGPTGIWPTLNSPKIAGIQYYRVLNIINLKLYNVLYVL